jgi:Niemann-Pick C1 protein
LTAQKKGENGDVASEELDEESGGGGDDEEKYLNAGALVITYVLRNYRDGEMGADVARGRAMAWEAQVLTLLANYTSDLVSVSYTTERSIEDEIERESTADIKIIGISYICMFFYLTLTLGKYSSCRMDLRTVLLETKIFLALGGVLIVLASVFSSGGIFTYLGVPVSFTRYSLLFVYIRKGKKIK